MSLPTSGAMALGRLRAEYNPAGSNTNVRLSQYNRNGLYVGNSCANITTQVLPTANGAGSNIKLAAHAYGHSFVIEANAFLGATDLAISPDDANAYAQFGATGTTTKGGVNSGTTNYHYIRPADGASTDIWQIRVTRTGGTNVFSAGSSTNNSWLNCNTAPQWNCINPRNLATTNTTIATVEFQTSGNGTLRAIATGVTWTAQVEV